MFNLKSAIAEAKARKEEQRKQAEKEQQAKQIAELAKHLPIFEKLLSEHLSPELMEGLGFKFRNSDSLFSQLKVEAYFSVGEIEFTLDKRNTTTDKYLYRWMLLFSSEHEEWSDGILLWTFDDDSLILATDEALTQYSLHVERSKEIEAKNAEPTPPAPPVSCGSRPNSAVTFRQQLAADCLIEIMGNPKYPKFTDDYAAELAIEAADALIKKLDQA